MALAGSGKSEGEYTYSGIKMRYTMTINSVTQSSDNKIKVGYNLKSYRVSGSGHPYASIQSYLNGAEKYNSGYNSYSSWPGKEGNNDYTHETNANTWGSNFTYQVKGHIGSSSSNTLSGNVQTVYWRTITYSVPSGTGDPVSNGGQYQGNSTTIAAKPNNIPSAYKFNGWNTKSDGTGTAYAAGASITMGDADVALYAQMELLKPTIKGNPVIKNPKETTIEYGTLEADIPGCTFYYSYKKGTSGTWTGWAVANAAGGTISGLDILSTYYVRFKAVYQTNESDIKDGNEPQTTKQWPSISSLSSSDFTAGTAVTIYLTNPCGRSVSITPSIGGNNVGNPATGVTGTSASITLTNSQIIARIPSDKKFNTVTFTSYYKDDNNVEHTSTTTAKITLKDDNTAKPSVASQSMINQFISLVNISDGKGDSSHLIKGKTSLKIKLLSAQNPFSPATGATLSSYSYKVDGTDKGTITLDTTTTDSFSIGASATNFKVTVICTDSRGFSNSCERNVSTTSITQPIFSLDLVKRSGNARTDVSFTSSGTWNSVITKIGNYEQGARVILEYKENTNPNWSSAGGAYGAWNIASTGDLSLVHNEELAGFSAGTFAVDKGYDFRLGVKNKYDSGYTYSSPILSIPRSEPIMFIDGGVNGVGINCFPRGEGLWLKKGLNTKSFLDMTYPIGSIYMSVNSTDPGTLFGGTWQPWGTGKVPVGIDTNDTAFNTVEKTGGSKTSVAAHTHTIGGSTGNQSANHTHSISSHSHTMAHTHNIGGKGITTTATTKTLTGQWRSTKARFPGGSSQDSNGIFKEWEASQSTYWSSGGGTDTNTVGWKIDARHEHTGKINDNTSTDGSSAENTGGTTLTTGNQSASHTHTLPANTGSTGTADIGNLQPYIVCYMWKRTA